MFKTMLVCSDGSDEALMAVRVAAKLAAHLASRVTLLTIFDRSEYSFSYYSALEVIGQVMDLDELKADISDRIERSALPIFEKAGVKCEPVREEGHPVGRIVHAARETKADLVVVGSRGLGTWQSLLLGNVSSGVLHHAQCPVLVVRGDRDSFNQILLGTDGSGSALEATTLAIGLGNILHARLTILNVCKPLAPVRKDAQKQLGGRSQRRIIDFFAQSAETVLKTAEVPPDIRQEEGAPAEAIVRIAESEKFDLIVVGSRGMGGFSSMLLGSVSDQVARHAHCPVLVAR